MLAFGDLHHYHPFEPMDTACSSIEAYFLPSNIGSEVDIFHPRAPFRVADEAQDPDCVDCDEPEKLLKPSFRGHALAIRYDISLESCASAL
jgi:hypothetical protein